MDNENVVMVMMSSDAKRKSRIDLSVDEESATVRKLCGMP